MTRRQEELDHMLYMRLFPLRRLFRQRLDRMHAEEADLFDEGEYSEEAGKLIRCQRLIDRVSARLPPEPPLFPEDEQQPADLQR
jgi:hypothetical protein